MVTQRQIIGSFIRHEYGSGPVDPASLMADWWDVDRSYTGTPAAITGLPSLGDGGLGLTYASNGPAATVVTHGTKKFVNLAGGNSNNRFFSDAVAAQIGTGASTPWTIALVYRVSSIADTMYPFSLNDGAPANNNQTLILMNTGQTRLSFRAPSGTLVRPFLAVANVADVTQSLVIRRNANGTIDAWSDGAHTDVAVPLDVGILNAMVNFTVGCLRTDANQYVGEMLGLLGPLGFHPDALPDAACQKVSDYIKDWGAA